MLRHIEVAPLGEGWAVAESTLDNAQFFKRRSDAEAAARYLGVCLANHGESSEITIRLSSGQSGGFCVDSPRPSLRRVEP